MANSFRRDVDEIFQGYIRNMVNQVVNPYHAASYPPNCRTDFLAPYDTDPLLAHPSYYGQTAMTSTPNPSSVRNDVVNLAYYYANIFRGRYGSISGGNIIGGGIGYFCLNDSIPTWDPRNSDQVNRFFVGTDRGFTGFSDGGGEDDGVSGTKGTCGLLDGTNITNWSRLSYWTTNYIGTNGNNVLYLRLRGANSSASNWVLTMYDENGKIIMGGRLVQRSGSSAYYVPGTFSLVPYINRTIYVRIRPDNPPVSGVDVNVPGHRTQVFHELGVAVASITGDLRRTGIVAQCNAAWSVIRARMDDVTVDLTVFSSVVTSSSGGGGGGGGGGAFPGQDQPISDIM